MSSPDGKRVFVANSGQDTITVIDTEPATSSATSTCATARATSTRSSGTSSRAAWRSRWTTSKLYVTRFLSFTKPAASRARTTAKRAWSAASTSTPRRTHRRLSAGSTPIGCRRWTPASPIATGWPHQHPAYPNQLQSIVIRGNRAYLPNIAASPQGRSSSRTRHTRSST